MTETMERTSVNMAAVEPIQTRTAAKDLMSMYENAKVWILTNCDEWTFPSLSFR